MTASDQLALGEKPGPVEYASEASLLDRLRTRYAWPEWLFLDHVRDAAGFDASRTADAIAFGLWPSRGLELHGFECKSSRADLARELADPEKCETICRYMDRWWLVCARGVVQSPADLPPAWGLMETRGKGLAVVREAPKLDPIPWSRSFVASLLRRDRQLTPPICTDAELAAKIEEARAAGRASGLAENQSAVADAERERDDLRRAVRRFEEASGVRIGTEWNAGDMGRLLALARAIQPMRASLEGLRRNLALLDRQLQATAAELPGGGTP